MGMYDGKALVQELATLRPLVRGLDEELALINLAIARTGTSTKLRVDGA
jgi:hypothetical protein